MRRIYLEIYLTVIGAALVAIIGVAAFGAWYVHQQAEEIRTDLRRSGELIAAALPGPDSSRSILQRELRKLADERHVSALLWSADGEIVAMSSRRPNEPGESNERRGRGLHRYSGGIPGPPPWAWTSVPWGDGGSLDLASADTPGSRGRAPIAFLAIFFGTLVLAAYPVARRIARGLETLREGVVQFGEGHFESRVEISGRHEVADVARAFNEAAERIEKLMTAQKRMIASASHELRSPLTRLQAAVEMLAAGRSDLLPEAEQSIAELDELVGDLLLAAHLESGSAPLQLESLDLMDLVEEEATRAGVRWSGGQALMRGDRRLLRRLIRNLLDNANRYGTSPVEASAVATDDSALIRVSDGGPAIPASERERLFEPFYRPPGHSEGKHGGVGLGLALVAEIAGLHGGEARCSEGAHGGTVFEVELPLAGPDISLDIAG
jgi:signal transduction histidine kinase